MLFTNSFPNDRKMNALHDIKTLIIFSTFFSLPAMFKFRALLLLPALIASSYGLILAVDSSQLVSKAIYTKARAEGFTKAIIRGYEEACGIGGETDPNYVSSYKNAREAGYTDIDMYWFPCNGSGHNCKSYVTQLSEIARMFKENSMNIGRIWIDFEKDSAVCNNVSFILIYC